VTFPAFHFSAEIGSRVKSIAIVGAVLVNGQGIFPNQFCGNNPNWFDGIDARYDPLLLDFFEL
jgi:hypothetical protein